MDGEWQGWGEDWDALRAGAGCVFCGRADVEDDEWGTRVLAGRAVTAFLSKTGVIPGYVVAIWSGRHVAEPTQLSVGEVTEYWHEVMRVGRAIEQCFDHAKMNYVTLGNGVPHLHTHIVPRPWRDPAPHQPLPFRYLDDGRQSDVDVHRDADRVRRALVDGAP
jgi:diadenosine tetraphosphate (Ap4A) HIT family hydrolase